MLGNLIDTQTPITVAGKTFPAFYLAAGAGVLFLVAGGYILKKRRRRKAKKIYVKPRRRWYGKRY